MRIIHIKLLYRQKLPYFIQLLKKNNYALYNLKCICIPSKQSH